MKKKITCSYCEKKGHNIVTCALKKSDAKSFEGRFPQKYSPGDMIRFVPAPPRYPNCHPRSPENLVNQLAIVISDIQEDYHGGAVFTNWSALMEAFFRIMVILWNWRHERNEAR